jgi:hypothetical protein
MEIPVKSASAADEAAVIGVITLAFCTDPIARWILRDEEQPSEHQS